MKEVTVVGKDFMHTFHDITGIRVAEGCLILTGESESLGEWAECYTLAVVHHWSVRDQQKVN